MLLLYIKEDKMKRLLVHLPVGLVNVLALWVSVPLGLSFTVGFLLYEVDEDWKIKNGAYRDVGGWLYGMALGTLVWAAYLVLR